MKKICMLIWMVTVPFYIPAYDFKVANADGVELAYTKLADSVSVAFTRDIPGPVTSQTIYSSAQVDTLRIPDSVSYNNKRYVVTQLHPNACTNMNRRINALYLPQTINYIEYGQRYSSMTSFIDNGLKSIIVHEANPKFCSSKGLLYTKDKKLLIAYPSLLHSDTIFIEEGVETLAGTSMVLDPNNNVSVLDLPLSLKKIIPFSISIESLRQLVIKDNVDTLQYEALYCWNLNHLTLGSGIKEVGTEFVNTDSVLHLYCRAIEPPTWKRHYNSDQHFLSTHILQDGILYVPQKSMALYRQAEGWSQFQHILPIEPPIVTESNSATISWVQNFSATGYQWHLYSDEEHMHLVMTLTFDERGYLTNIILGDISATPNYRHMMNNAEDNDDTERRFAEYYSFTISSLNPATQYYFVRQSFHGDEVIDEEQGSFNTLPATPTNLEQANDEDPSRPTKSLHGGQVLIHRGDADYDLTGRKMELRE